MKSWWYEIIELNGDWHKVIQDVDNKKVIAIVDNLDKEFVIGLINIHNDNVSKAYREGITDRREIVEELNNKKKIQ